MHIAVLKYNKSFASLFSKLLFLFPSWLVLQNFGVWFDIYMKHGNLSDGDTDKITWKRIRNLLTRLRENVTLRRGGDVPQRRYWVFDLGLTGDVVDTYHWDVLVKYQRDVVGGFIWDLLETSWRRTDETLLLRHLETSSRRSNKMSWRRTTETS